ncbi:MAG: hypothetical protein JW757_05710 [Anaerolineales bacterium]|nr:hypothetical protein [Anaerolineales bacterium]
MSENATTLAPEPASGGTSKKSLLPLVIFLLFVVIILIGGVGFLLLSGGNSLLSLPGNLVGSSGIDQDTFVLNMNKLVLAPEDMTARYTITPGGNLHMNNSQLSNNMGAAFGKPFIVNTGRIDGWDLAMERVNPDDFTPEYVRSRVEIYETTAGAADALSEEWFWAYQLEDRMPDQYLDKNCGLGKDCVTFMYSEVKPASGAAVERYDVAFRYENVVVWVFIKGSQGEVTEDLVLEYGQIILDKIKLLEN